MTTTASKRTILLVGNLADGFQAYGPFGDHEAATVYAWNSGIHANHKNWVMALSTPHGAGQIPEGCFATESEPHLVMAGDPLQGWQALGPFFDFDEADAWANKYVSGETWILPLLNPETGK